MHARKARSRDRHPVRARSSRQVPNAHPTGRPRRRMMQRTCWALGCSSRGRSLPLRPLTFAPCPRIDDWPPGRTSYLRCPLTFIAPSLFRRGAEEMPSPVLTLVVAGCGRGEEAAEMPPEAPQAPRGGGLNHAPVIREPCFVFVPATLSRRLLSFHPRRAGNSRFPGLG